MTAVLERHPGVRSLCDNGWLQLLAMDDDGYVSQRYAGDLRWEPSAIGDDVDQLVGVSND